MIWLFLFALSFSASTLANAKSPLVLQTAPNCAIPMHGKANTDPACKPAGTDEARLKQGATAKDAPYQPDKAERMGFGKGGRCKTTSDCPAGFFCSPQGDCSNTVLSK